MPHGPTTKHWRSPEDLPRCQLYHGTGGRTWPASGCREPGGQQPSCPPQYPLSPLGAMWLQHLSLSALLVSHLVLLGLAVEGGSQEPILAGLLPTQDLHHLAGTLLLGGGQRIAQRPRHREGAQMQGILWQWPPCKYHDAASKNRQVGLCSHKIYPAIKSYPAIKIYPAINPTIKNYPAITSFWVIKS